MISDRRNCHLLKKKKEKKRKAKQERSRSGEAGTEWCTGWRNMWFAVANLHVELRTWRHWIFKTTEATCRCCCFLSAILPRAPLSSNDLVPFFEFVRGKPRDFLVFICKYKTSTKPFATSRLPTLQKRGWELTRASVTPTWPPSRFLSSAIPVWRMGIERCRARK